MRYTVTDRFYSALMGLLEIAFDDNDPAEIDLAMQAINDTEAGQDGFSQNIRSN